MDIRPIQLADVNDIAIIHEKALPWSINGRLGRTHLADLYELLLSGSDSLGHVALHKGNIVAFQVSSTNWMLVRQRLRQIALSNKIKMALGCLSHPSDFIALFEAAFLIPRAFAKTGVSAEILAWAAAPDNPIAAIAAQRCLLHSISELARRGEAYCLGQMQKPNARPMASLLRLHPEIVSRYIRNDVLVFDCVEIAERNAAKSLIQSGHDRRTNTRQP